MSKEQEDQEEQRFRITDKRLFREDGEPRGENPENSGKESGTGKTPEARFDQAAPAEAPPGTGAHIDFPSYVLSYYTQSLVLLGEVPNPYTNKTEEDLEAARHTVDILGMLKDKTKGNLSPDEEQLLESVLYEVRMKYMAKTRHIKLP